MILHKDICLSCSWGSEADPGGGGVQGIKTRDAQIVKFAGQPDTDNSWWYNYNLPDSQIQIIPDGEIGRIAGYRYRSR